MDKRRTVSEERKQKSAGKKVYATVPKEQYEMIEKLDGTLGVGTNGVVSSIINSWFEHQEWYGDIIKDKVKK